MALPVVEVEARPLPPLPTDDPRFRIPTLRDVYQARRVVDRYLPHTPLVAPAAIAEKLGYELFLKCETMQPIGAFKVRGGIYLMSLLSDEERSRGVVTASTGNHGQSIAFAAREFGARALVYMPERANPLKVASMRRLGAEVAFYGADFDESRLEAERRAERDGMTFIHSMNDWRLLAGVGTATLEIMEQVPDLDAILVPVGGGSGVCGACIAGKGINPDLQVIGVQAAGAAAVATSWRRRELVSFDRTSTFAEGLATRTMSELPAHVMWEAIDDFCLVSDAEIRRAMLTILETTRLLTEGAGAASVAAAWQLKDRFAGKKIACVLSGGNVTLEGLRHVMDEEQPW